MTKYHDRLLRLTGEDGAWELSTIGTAEERLSFDKEKESLMEKLRDVENWKKRVQEIEAELAFKKPDDQE